MRNRTNLFNGLLFILAVCFLGYLFYIQCLRNRHYARLARRAHQKKVLLCGTRGNIYDRNGIGLATSQPCYSIFCTPQYSPDRARLAVQIAAISTRPLSQIRELIEKNRFFWVQTKVDLKTKEAYLSINDPSIGYTHDLHREYNMPEIFASLLGRCGTDNIGLEGLELIFDEILAGKPGFTVYQLNPAGEIFPYHHYPEKKTGPGQDIYLTIDLQLQTILYSHLKDYLIKEAARAATGLIINPTNGEILALVNISNDNCTRNRVVCDEFEPGSTFKIVPLVYSLLIGNKEDDLIDTNNGKIKIGGHVICDYKNYGIVTLEQAIAHSSNVAMVKLAKKFNRKDFFLLIQDFGFTELTGIQFPGETKGRLSDPVKMNELEFATLVFGQGLSCTLLQLAFAYQAIANNGLLNKPLIVREIRNGRQIVHQTRPLRIRRIVDEDIAKRVTEMLCAVVEYGTGVEAQLDGIKVAAKTGTAQKVVNGRYSKTRVITSFVGYFPAQAPEYLIAIMLDEPQKGRWAGAVTAPLFKHIAQSICQMNHRQYAVK